MQSYSHTHSLGHQTGLAARLFNKLLTKRFSNTGINMTAEQWGIILILRNNGAMTQWQLGEMLSLEKSTVSRSISGLERRGWVVCKRNAKDGRHKLATLTSNAINIAQQCSMIAKSVLEDAQAGLNPKAVSASLEQLSGVIKNLRELNQLRSPNH